MFFLVKEEKSLRFCIPWYIPACMTCQTMVTQFTDGMSLNETAEDFKKKINWEVSLTSPSNNLKTHILLWQNGMQRQFLICFKVLVTLILLRAFLHWDFCLTDTQKWSITMPVHTTCLPTCVIMLLHSQVYLNSAIQRYFFPPYLELLPIKHQYWERKRKLFACYFHYIHNIWLHDTAIFVGIIIAPPQLFTHIALSLLCYIPSSATIKEAMMSCMM